MSKLRVIKVGISIHAPRGGSDANHASEYIDSCEFQSTLPVGGATKERKLIRQVIEISIHAPRGGSDFSMDIL